MSQFTQKFPAEVLDYPIDFTNRLENGDTIPSAASATVASADFTVNPTPKATTLDAPQKIVTFWLGGGIIGVTGKATCTVVTTLGRTVEAEIFITVLAP